MVEHESLLRATIFIATLLALVLAEWLWPRREASTPRFTRSATNLLMVIVATLLVRVALPVAAVGWAAHMQSRGWGLLNQVSAPDWVEGLLAFVALDLAIFLQHWTAHKVPLLWRLHRMHHSDLGFDASTGVRFHPVEILLSMLWKMAVVSLLGASPVAVLVFEIVLSSSSLWEHANLRLPQRVDHMLRSLIVTPDMHRVHHSIHRDETDSNYGFNFSFWDRLFRTYRMQPRDGHTAMIIGLPTFRALPEQRLHRLLLQPLFKDSQ